LYPIYLYPNIDAAINLIITTITTINTITTIIIAMVIIAIVIIIDCLIDKQPLNYHLYD